MIKKTGSKYTVYSESGKRLSKPLSKKGAKKRLAQVEAFKHMDKSYEASKDLKEHEKGAKKRFKKIYDATENIQETLKELDAADEALAKAIDERRTVDNNDVSGERVGLQDVSASKKTLEVDSEKGDRADRVEIDAYKAFLNKSADDPSYTVEVRDGIADYDRHLIDQARKLNDLKNKKYKKFVKGE